MNIREQLLLEHTKANAQMIADYASTSPANFKQLMHCFTAAEYRLAQRAAWSVSIVASSQPTLIKPYINNLVQQLKRKDVHAAVVRNSLRILTGIEIPQNVHGELMSTCFDFLQTPATPVAVKAFSISILHKLAKCYPEIMPELQLIIRDNWDNETPAYRARGRKILHENSGGAYD